MRGGKASSKPCDATVTTRVKAALLAQKDVNSFDIKVKTFNGGVYSDFLLAALPQQAVKEERRNGKLIVRADRYTGGRVGNGGPEIRVENFNGDIRVLERHD